VRATGLKTGYCDYFFKISLRLSTDSAKERGL